MPQSNEHRRHPRVSFEAPARLSTPAGDWETHIADISLQGILLEKPEDWPEDFHFDDCHIDVPLNADTHIRMDARVRRITPDGHIGLEWNSLDVESLGHLRRLLELNLGEEIR